MRDMGAILRDLVGAACADQFLPHGAQLLDVAAQALDHYCLHVDDAGGGLSRRDVHYVEQCRVAQEEVGMGRQPGRDLVSRKRPALLACVPGGHRADPPGGA
jgi:hypothetical protein